MSKPSGSDTASMQMYRLLLSAYGPQGWWPGANVVEICVGAVLVQNTTWKNVETSLSRLRGRGMLEDFAPMCELSEAMLRELIRPSGSFRRKAGTLQALGRYFLERHEGDPRRLSRLGVQAARAQLLGIHGIGPETADCILLYAADMTVFVADSYAKRVGIRHGLLSGSPKYERIQSAFRDGLPVRAEVYNEYHALLVRVGKDHCGAAEPNCRGCPLESTLEG